MPGLARAEDFGLPKEAMEEGFSIKKDELFAQPSIALVSVR